MCRGYFTTTNGIRRPRVSSAAFPTTEVGDDLSFKSGYAVDFLLDTGADRTCFTRTTAEKLGYSFGGREPSEKVNGVGEGTTGQYVLDQPYTLVFDERDEDTPNRFHYEYFDEMRVLPTLDSNILGRDFINRFELDYSDYHDRIEMTRIEDAAGDFDVIG